MTERVATVCGYTLFCTVFLLLVVGGYLVSSKWYTPEVLPIPDTSINVDCPVTISSWVDTYFVAADTPQVAQIYVMAMLAPGYHIYSIDSKTPAPIRTNIILCESGEFKTVGTWITYLDAVDGKHSRKAIWGIKIESKIPLKDLKISGSIRVNPCNDTSCCVLDPIQFEVITR